MTEKKEVVASAKPASAFAKFGDMWTKFAEKQANAVAGAQKVELPADKLAAAAAKLQFTNGVTKEQLAAIAVGGEEAVAATLALINAAGQDGFQKSAQVSAAMLQEALNTQAATLKSSLPDMIKDVQSGTSVSKSMPGLDDPAFAALGNAVRSGILANNPGASAEEVAAEVKEYFMNLAQVVSPTAETKGEGDVPFNWDEYLDLTPVAAKVA